ncbi:PAS domain S-box protein [Danxiaibacter flavus]|uniref:histidine kinase n=1 Tax=Danxiaibacter flavus TaxID=3049108 RepID=A0ABV3ZMJ3_9BACT|nr:PAS domain S-box protein [Chitinophagaceae bacterium DXS]
MQRTVSNGKEGYTDKFFLPRDISIQNLIDYMPIAIYACSLSGHIIYYNKAAEKLWGYKPKAGEDMWSGSAKLFLPDGVPLPMDKWPMTIAIQQGIYLEEEEVVIQQPGGTKLNVLEHPMPVFDSDGKLLCIINVLLDVTEQRKSETKQAMLAAIVESSDDAIVSKSLNGIITSWNFGAQEMFGYEEQEIIGKPITTIIPEQYRMDELMILNKIRNNEHVEHFETYRITKDGTLIPVSLTISPITDKRGNIIGASKIARNISKQKEAEKALQHHAENLEIMNGMGKVISQTLDIDVILQTVADSTTRLTGAAIGAFFYNTVNDKNEPYMLCRLSGAAKEAFENFAIPRSTAVFSSTFNGGATIRSDDITHDERYARNMPFNGMPEGHLPVVSYLAVPVVSKNGKVTGGLFFGHPQPGRFTKEHEDLVSAIALHAAIALDNAKLYAEVTRLSDKKDEFISLASHELKTPITSLSGFLQLIEESLDDGDENKKFMKIALAQVKKLSDLISDLLDVSKVKAGKLPLSFSHFDLVQLTKEVVTQFQYSVRSHAVQLDCKLEKVMVHGDRQRIEQVIINLLANAVKYSPGAAEVKVLVTGNNATASVSVQDFGIGIAPELHQHIFSRFFRIEDEANKPGLGIGLYICKEIIQRHSGRLWLSSVPSVGSIFGFDIPAA